MVSVLMLFLLPVGGGIPAGVFLAHSEGLAWPITAGLYLVSDVVLALAFEPLLRLLVHLGRRVPFIGRVGAAMKVAMARSATHFSGNVTGPFTLILIAFGVDPMTGRAAALAAGHGFLSGWAFAIGGDMLYYAVIAITTLRLNAYIRNPNTTMYVVLGAMIVAPMLVRFFRSKLRPHPSRAGLAPGGPDLGQVIRRESPELHVRTPSGETNGSQCQPSLKPAPGLGRKRHFQ